MDYIRQLNAFDFKSAGILPSNAVNIYFRLFQINNRYGLDEQWFETTDEWLMLSSGIKTPNTIRATRNLLKQKGFIDFVAGGASKPTKYKIINLIDVLTINTSTNTSTDRSTNTSTNTSTDRSTNNIIDKSKREENDNSPACEKVVDEFQNAIHPLTNLSDLEMVRALANDYGPEWCVMAIAEARRAKNGNTAFLPVKYIGTILRNWKQAGGPPGSMAPSPIVPLVDYDEQRRKTQELIRKRDAEMADLARKRMGIS